jgi:hypothetical protein
MSYPHSPPARPESIPKQTRTGPHLTQRVSQKVYNTSFLLILSVIRVHLRQPLHTVHPTDCVSGPPCYHQASYTHCHQASYQPILTSPRSLEEGVLHGYPDRRYGTRRFALLLFMAILFIPFAYIVRSISGADTMNVLQISVVFVVEAARLYPWIGRSD